MNATLATAINSETALLVRLATTPVASGYGIDLVCQSDMTPHADETDPETVESLAQDLYHRITTERGTLDDDPNFGRNVRSMLHKANTPREILTVEGLLSAECQEDERVDTARASATYAQGRLDVSIAITPKDPALGPFALVISVTSAGALLEAINRGVS